MGIEKETTSEGENPATKAAESAISVVTEIVSHVPMAYIVAALAAGFVIGVGVVLLMDDASVKHQLKELAEEDTIEQVVAEE